MWGEDVDEIYTSLNIKAMHWVALLINIHKRHIDIWDSDLTVNKDMDIEAAIIPVCDIMAYIMNIVAPPELKDKYPYELYTYERVPQKCVPKNKNSGDCGVYCLKYIECHALGIQFDQTRLCDKNIKFIREKMATEIYDELGITGTEKRGYEGLDLYDER